MRIASKSIPFAVACALVAPGAFALQAPVQKWAYAGCTVSSCQTGWYAGPAVANLDADSQMEVIWGAYNLWSFNGLTGAQEWQQASPQRIWPAVAVGDLDDDGDLEIVVARQGISVLNANGTTFGGWPQNPFASAEVRTLAITNLETDTDMEIIVGRATGGGDRYVNVFEHTGTQRTGWPARHMGEPGYGAGLFNENIAIADFNGDGIKEIIAPTDTHYINAFKPNGDQLLASTLYGTPAKTWAQVGVHVDQAADLAGFANCGTQHRPNFANAAPSIGDLDGNGVLEIVVPGDVYNCAIGDPAGDLYYLPWILRIDRTRWSGAGFDWTTLPPPGASGAALSQDFNVIENSVSNAVLADLDNDGQKEILFASYDGKLHAWWLDKTEHSGWPFDVPGSGIRFAAEPVVVDLDNDGFAEVLFTSWPQKTTIPVAERIGRLHVLDHLGAQLFAVDLPAPRGVGWTGGLAAPTLAQLDTDADLELVIGTSGSGAVAYDLPGTPHARVLWGTARGGMHRTGVAEPFDFIYRDDFQ